MRALAELHGVRPTKALGQNFVHDANTVRRIVRIAGVAAGERVLEIGPGLGSLTGAIVEAGATVAAVEIDPVLARALRERDLPGVDVVEADAVRLDPAVLPGPPPTRLVANLPYNVSVPVLLRVLETMPSVAAGVVMVQAEVGERLAARAGDDAYGVPSVKAAWWADVRTAGPVPRTVFWPVPNVDSVLVAFDRHEPLGGDELRRRTFAAIDAAFAQRRKALRSALAPWAGSPAAAEALLRQVGVDPLARGETLPVTTYAALARARTA